MLTDSGLCVALGAWTSRTHCHQPLGTTKARRAEPQTPCVLWACHFSQTHSRGFTTLPCKGEDPKGRIGLRKCPCPPVRKGGSGLRPFVFNFII